jgi:hypothetical protein
VPKAKAPERDPVLVELQQIKGLLMLLLLKAGASSDEIALATGMGASTVRKSFPAQRFEEFQPR